MSRLSLFSFCIACNILLEGLTDVYTLRNYGKHVNCSLTTLNPAQVKILSLGVGLGKEQKRTLTEQETGTIHKVNSFVNVFLRFIDNLRIK